MLLSHIDMIGWKNMIAEFSLAIFNPLNQIQAMSSSLADWWFAILYRIYTQVYIYIYVYIIYIYIILQRSSNKAPHHQPSLPPENKTGSCGITVMLWRNRCKPKVLISTSSSFTHPESVSTIRSSTFNTEDLPAPVRPQIPILRPG